MEEPLEESLILQVCVEETSNLPKIQRSLVPPIKLTFCLCQSNCLCRFFAFIFAFDFVFVFKETTILPQFNGACQSLQLNLHSQFPYLSSSLSFLSFSLEDIVLTFVIRIYSSPFNINQAVQGGIISHHFKLWPSFINFSSYENMNIVQRQRRL